PAPCKTTFHSSRLGPTARAIIVARRSAGTSASTGSAAFAGSSGKYMRVKSRRRSPRAKIDTTRCGAIPATRPVLIVVTPDSPAPAPGPDARERQRALAVGRAPADAAAPAVLAAGVAPRCIGLPDLDAAVGDRRTVSVEEAAGDRDALARDARGRELRDVAAREGNGEERTDGRRGGRDESRLTPPTAWPAGRAARCRSDSRARGDPRWSPNRASPPAARAPWRPARCSTPDRAAAMDRPRNTSGSPIAFQSPVRRARNERGTAAKHCNDCARDTPPV